MNKKYITTGVITALLASNVIFGYQFSNIHQNDLKTIEEQQDKIKVLSQINEEHNNKINTYEVEINKLQEIVKERNAEVVELEKELKKARDKESP